MVQELPDALKKVTREALFFPGIQEQEEIIVSVSEIVGTVASWAIRQSPYAVPENLEVVCKKLDEILASGKPFGKPLDDDVRLLTIKRLYPGDGAVTTAERGIHNVLHTIPEYLAWNDRKNGNQEKFQFTSRYDGKRDPDDDFIDLGALERNVAMSLVQRYIIESRDGWVATPNGSITKFKEVE